METATIRTTCGKCGYKTAEADPPYDVTNPPNSYAIAIEKRQQRSAPPPPHKTVMRDSLPDGYATAISKLKVTR